MKVDEIKVFRKKAFIGFPLSWVGEGVIDFIAHGTPVRHKDKERPFIFQFIASPCTLTMAFKTGAVDAYILDIQDVDYEVYVAKDSVAGNRLGEILERYQKVVNGDWRAVDKELNILALTLFPTEVHDEIFFAVYRAGKEAGVKSVKDSFRDFLDLPNPST